MSFPMMIMDPGAARSPARPRSGRRLSAVVGVLAALTLAVSLASSASSASAAPREPRSGNHIPATELPHVECAIPGQADDNVLVILKHVADQRQVTDKVRLAMYETAWVESHANNLNCGDRDSVGVFQQRPSMGWGTVDQLLDVDYATGKFLDGNSPLPGAIVVDQQNPSWSAGQVSQEVQRSAYPEKYDEAEPTARDLIARAAAIDDGTTPPPSHYFVKTFSDAPVFDSPTSSTQTGTLNAGTNYVYCKVWRRVTGDDSAYNHWWLRTDPDTGPAGQYVSAYYLSDWGNDEAKDTAGTEIGDC